MSTQIFSRYIGKYSPFENTPPFVKLEKPILFHQNLKSSPCSVVAVSCAARLGGFAPKHGRSETTFQLELQAETFM